MVTHGDRLYQLQCSLKEKEKSLKNQVKKIYKSIIKKQVTCVDVLLVSNKDRHLLARGERGGLVVEPRTPEREVGVQYLPLPCCVLEQRHIYSKKSTCNTQEELAPS